MIFQLNPLEKSGSHATEQQLGDHPRKGFGTDGDVHSSIIVTSGLPLWGSGGGAMPRL